MANVIIDPPEAEQAGCSATLGTYSGASYSTVEASPVPGKNNTKSYTGQGITVQHIDLAEGWALERIDFKFTFQAYSRFFQKFEAGSFTPLGPETRIDYRAETHTWPFITPSSPCPSVTEWQTWKQDASRILSTVLFPYWGDDGNISYEDWYESKDEYTRVRFTESCSLDSVTVKFKRVCRVELKINPDSLDEDRGRHIVDHTGNVTGGGVFPSGTRITVSATPNQGFRFLYWSKSAKGKYGDSDFLYDRPSMTLTVPAAPSYVIYAHFDGTTPGIIYNPLVSGNPIAFRRRLADDPAFNPYPIIAR